MQLQGRAACAPHCTALPRCCRLTMLTVSRPSCGCVALGCSGIWCDDKVPVPAAGSPELCIPEALHCCSSQDRQCLATLAAAEIQQGTVLGSPGCCCCSNAAAGRQLGSACSCSIAGEAQLYRQGACIACSSAALCRSTTATAAGSSPLNQPLRSGLCSPSGHGPCNCNHASAGHCLQSQACQRTPFCVPSGAHSALPL